jgi:transcriptional regulator with XRE-family HTH domain
MVYEANFGPPQSKAARALLGWSQADLAREAKVGTSTVADFERDHRHPQAGNVEAMRAAFEGEGVTFYAGGVINGPLPALSIAAAGASGGRKVFRYFTATDLIQWADRRDAQAKLPELIGRLIRADLGHGPKIHFPSDESVQQAGWDGTCVADAGSEHVPAGPSGWEMGTQAQKITAKASSDYKKRTANPDGLDPPASSLVFVTPRRWSRKNAWIRERKAEGKWLDVRAYNADDLLHWIEKHPSVGNWLAVAMGKLPEGVRQLEDVWDEWVRAPRWLINTDLVLADRDEEAARVHRWLREAPRVLAVQAESADEAIAFLRASLRQLPDDHRVAHETRCLVALSAEEARKLADSISRLIIVIADPPPGLAQWLTDNGHHVYAAYDSDVGLPQDVCRLSRPFPQSIESALFDMMVTADGDDQRGDRLGSLKDRARKLAEDSARSLTILRRLMAAGGVPAWAAAPRGRAVLAALLAGAWDESKPRDVQVLERLYRGDHASLTAELAPLLGAADSPVRKAGTTWKIASPRDAWYLLANQITSADLNDLESCALDVLQAPDPRFDLDSEGRDMAGIRGIVRAHSDALREGLIQTLLLLSLFGQQIRSDTTGPLRADRLVQKLLSNADSRQWWSLSEDLRLLAEVSPRTFLDAVEDSLAAPDTPVTVLLKEDTGPFARSYLSNLLWGLEALAWDPQYLGAVANVLAGLAVHDQGDRQIQNRPKNSLREIFLTLRPQTNATLEERLGALDSVREREPAVAWTLMFGIYPRGSVVSHPSALPRWRDFSMNEVEKLTGPLFVRAADELIKRLLEDVGVDVDRWKDLIELLPTIPMAAPRGAVIQALIRVAGEFTDEADRLTLRAAVHRVVSQHRRFATAPWAMPSPELEQLEHIVATLEPSDSVTRATWTFNQPSGLGPTKEREANEQSARQAQNAALADALAEHGIDGLFRLAAAAKIPRMVGVAAGTLPESDTRDTQILMRGLSSDANESERDVALGMVRQYFLARGREWVQSLVKRAVAESWGTDAIAGILSELPPNRETWDIASSLGADVDDAYWKRIFIYGIQEDSAGVALAIEKLMAAGRMREAVEVAGNWVQDPDGGLRQVRATAERTRGDQSGAPATRPVHLLPTELLVRLLKQVASRPPSQSAGRNDMTMFQYYVTEILKFLDEAKGISRETMAFLEWTYLSLLEYSDRPPRTLQEELARSPEFFVTVLSALYRPEPDSGVTDSNATDSDSAAVIAQQAFQLLRTWDRMPGRQEDGSIDLDELVAWVYEARRASAKVGRTAVGDMHIGEILSKAPADNGGVWPIEAVRKVIESTRSRDLERGVGTGVYNQRGVTGRNMNEGGRQERSLAQTYRNWSRTMSGRSPRTAAVLERIARDFEADGRSNDEEAEQRTWS